MHVAKGCPSQPGPVVAAGNHEYDYRTGSEKRHDPSGTDRPYDPEWGNFGNDSGGECGVSVSKRFPMPGGGGSAFFGDGEDSQSDADIAATPAAGASNSDDGDDPPQSSAGSSGADGVSDDAASNGTDAGGGGGAGSNHHRHRVRANPPFWYSYDYGSVHFTIISTEHNLEKGSAQYQVRQMQLGVQMPSWLCLRSVFLMLAPQLCSAAPMSW